MDTPKTAKRTPEQQRAHYATKARSRGITIPAGAYTILPKAPSRRDLHRIEVAERKKANQH